MEKLFTALLLIEGLFKSFWGHAETSIPNHGKVSDPELPLTVYVVHKAEKKSEIMVVDIWDAASYGLRYHSGHQKMEVAPIEPHILLGIMPTEEVAYRFSTDNISSTGIMRIALDGYPVIQNYFVSPGDSVMMSINEKAGMITFSGPAAPKYRLQYEIQRLLYESNQEQDITLPFESEAQFEAFLLRNDNRPVYEKTKRIFGRVTKPIIAGNDELEYLRSIHTADWEKKIDHLADSYSGAVNAQLLDLIRASALARLHQAFLGRLSSAFGRILKMEDPGLEEAFRDFSSKKLEKVPLELIVQKAHESPAARSYLTAQTQLKVALNQSDFWTEVNNGIPVELSERIAVEFLVSNRTKFKDFEHLAFDLYSKIESTSLKAELETLLGRFGSGTEIFPFEFITADGNPLDLEKFEGKTVLVDFWITGCSACKFFHDNLLGAAMSDLDDLSDLVIVSVCSDLKPDHWLKGTKNRENKSQIRNFIEVYAPRTAGSNPFLEYYNIHTYPQIMLINGDGTLKKIGRAPSTKQELLTLFSDALPN